MNAFFRPYTLILCLGLCLTVAALPGLLSAQEQDILNVKVGDENLREKTLDIKSGVIYSTRTGREISFDAMIKEMAQSHFVYVGESHDSMAMHDIQARVADALYQQDHNLAIGLEMFDVTNQEILNKWSAGILTENEFKDLAPWYETWNFNYQYYKKIFDLAKAGKIPVYALNVPRKVIRKVRMMGWKALDEEEKSIVPQADLTIEDHRTLMKVVFGDIEMPPQMKSHGGGDMMFEGLYRAQAAWDTVMAQNTLKAADVEQSRVVVLAGSGHMIYNLGINMRVALKHKAAFKTVICVEVPESEGKLTVTRSLADYVWGIPEEDRPVYPTIGLAMKKFDGMNNPVIERDPISGIAKGQDFKKGDVILKVDDMVFNSIHKMRSYLNQYGWGDEVVFKLLREAKEVTSTLKYEVVEDPEEKTDIQSM
jgi:uncharacterized iron-regulated protein